MSSVDFRWLRFLFFGFWILIEEPIMKFFVNHCDFIVHFNHYSKTIHIIIRIGLKLYVVCIIILSIGFHLQDSFYCCHENI